MRYILVVDGIDYSCDALVNWSVSYGRDNPDTQPGTGRGQWTLILDKGDRAPNIVIGDSLWFSAVVGGVTLPVATMVVSQVTRTFSWTNDGPRNTIRIDAVGVTVRLTRDYLPKTDYLKGSPFREEGARVLDVVSGYVTPVSSGRTPANHLLDDRMPAASGRWGGAQVTLGGGLWSGLTRSPNVSPTGTYDLEFVFDSDCPVEVRVNVDPLVSWVFPTAGRHTVDLVAPVNGPLTVEFRHFDPQTAVKWKNADPVGPQWDQANQQWLFGKSFGSGTVTLIDVDGWLMGSEWDMGKGFVAHRYFASGTSDEQAAEVEDRLSYIEKIGQAFRGALWELRDGRVVYLSRRRHRGAVELHLDACHVLADNEAVFDLSQVRNRVRADYGNQEAGQRPTVEESDGASRQTYGSLEWSTTGPIETKDIAREVVKYVLATHRVPHERLPQVSMLPLESLPEAVVVGLLRLIPGSVVQIDGAPALGWLGSSWKGFLEGTELQGSASGTTMVLKLSEFLQVALARSTEKVTLYPDGKPQALSGAPFQGEVRRSGGGLGIEQWSGSAWVLLTPGPRPTAPFLAQMTTAGAPDDWKQWDGHRWVQLPTWDAPPPSPTVGMVGRIGAGTGAFRGHDGQEVQWSGTDWRYLQ